MDIEVDAISGNDCVRNAKVNPVGVGGLNRARVSSTRLHVKSLARRLQSQPRQVSTNQGRSCAGRGEIRGCMFHYARKVRARYRNVVLLGE